MRRGCLRWLLPLCYQVAYLYPEAAMVLERVPGAAFSSFNRVHGERGDLADVYVPNRFVGRCPDIWCVLYISCPSNGPREVEVGKALVSKVGSLTPLSMVLKAWLAGRWMYDLHSRVLVRIGDLHWHPDDSGCVRMPLSASDYSNPTSGSQAKLLNACLVKQSSSARHRPRPEALSTPP